MNYRGNSGFGTILGGTLSLITSIFFIAFISVQMYAWIFTPDYGQTFTKNYLQKTSEEVYTVPTSVFLPTISFYSIANNGDMYANYAKFYNS